MKNNIIDETVKYSGNEMATKRIYNPRTKAYYEIRQRTTKKGKKGQIKGRWKR